MGGDRVEERFLLSRVVAVEEGENVRLGESVKVGPTHLPDRLAVGVISRLGPKQLGDGRCH